MPPGFTITTEVCTAYYDNNNTYPDELTGQVSEALRRIESAVGRGFGDSDKPLLVSVRSGARVSMPGMMDTVLNLGLNDVTVKGLATGSGDPRFAWDSYRRFIQMYGSVVLGVDHHRFEEIIETAKLEADVIEDTALTPERTGRKVVEEYTKNGGGGNRQALPAGPAGPVMGRDRRRVRLLDEPARQRLSPACTTSRPSWGTAVNVQAMVFGNMGDDCATGVCFTRDPSTGLKRILRRVPGERAGRGRGRRHPHAAPAVRSGLRQAGRGEHGKVALPDAYAELVTRFAMFWKNTTRTCRTSNSPCSRTSCTCCKPAAASAPPPRQLAHRRGNGRCEGLIDRDTAIMRVNPASLDQLAAPDAGPEGNA